MSLGLSNGIRVCLAVTAFGWGGLVAGTVLAGDKPAAEAETPAQKTPATNAIATQPSAPRNGLLRLEEQLSRSFQFLKPSPSLEGVPAPPVVPRTAPPILNKRAKDLLEQRKNWVFANPDDVTAAPKLEELLNMPEYGADGLKKQSFSPVERFYLDLDQRRAAKAKQDPFASEDARRPGNESGWSQDPNSGDDPYLPSEVRKSELALRKLLNQEGSEFAPAPTRGTSLDVFGLPDQTISPEEIARKAYLKEFQQWLDRPTATANGHANPFGAPASSRLGVTAPSGLNPLAPISRPDNFDPTIGAANPTLLVGAPQDVTAKVLNQWNPLYVPPKIEPPQTTPPKPVFDVPRRKF